MLAEYRVEQIDLRFGTEKEQLWEFLRAHHLKPEQDLDVAFGVFDLEDTLCGCGCAAGSLLKCFAVAEELRGQNALGSLVSELVQNRFARGLYDLFVITRAKNKELFAQCGFYPLAQTQELVMLENTPRGPENFVAPFWCAGDETKTVGAIVMNCNPFTRGHRALVEYAASQCDVLHLFVVEEDRSAFSTATRLRLVRSGVADLPCVRVHRSGPYMISGATFPTYFLKENEDVTRLQTQLDIALFAQRIAPALHITRRFAGEEPLDPVTAQYNDAMRSLLAEHGVEFVEIPRVAEDGAPISASRVRRLLQTSGVCADVLTLVPKSTAAYLKTEFVGFDERGKAIER